MDKLNQIKMPALTARFRNTVIPLNWYPKMKTTGCTVTGERHRRESCILRYSVQILKRMKKGKFMNPIRGPHSLVILHGASVTESMHKRKSGSTCRRNGI